MDSDEHPRIARREPCGAVDGAKLLQLLTICFTLAVALACTGESLNFKSGSSGGSKKKKNDNNGKSSVVMVVRPGSATTERSAAPGRTEPEAPASRRQSVEPSSSADVVARRRGQ